MLGNLSRDLLWYRNSPPSRNINWYLVITGEANVKLLSMSTNECSPSGTSGAHTVTPSPCAALSVL